jgi:hypothetical protein
MSRTLILVAALTGLAGCAATDVARYQAEQPVLDLREYFNGTLDAYGMFQKRGGEVAKRFHVVIEASWQGDTGTLDERFSYSDGSTQRRVWTITRKGVQPWRKTDSYNCNPPTLGSAPWSVDQPRWVSCPGRSIRRR